MRELVVIVGGGVAGLSAAQELVERGFDVHVYERRERFGGKAASRRNPSPAPAGEKHGGTPVPAAGDPGRPGEHGFRFFPGWYRHLTDTMSRIPYHRPDGGRTTVLDNLVSVQANLLAWFDRAPVVLPLKLPRSANDVNVTSQFITEFGHLGLSPGEVGLFFRKLVEFIALPDERRAQKLEGVTWWDYLECSHPERSRAYKDLVRATTRPLVAAKAEQASAYSIGRVAVRTLLDTLSSVDRVLNGPTSEVWLDPWVEHLKSLGVTFHLDRELASIHVDRKRHRVREIVTEPVAVANARRLRRLLARRKGSGKKPPNDIGAEVTDLIAQLAKDDWVTEKHTELGERLTALAPKVLEALIAQPEVGRVSAPANNPVADMQSLLSTLETSAHAQQAASADYFVLALPLEQLAYYVNRSTMLTFLAPELRKVVRLARHLDWMAGIQFYLRSPLDVAAGHLVGMDSTWALTAIEQTQFWRNIPLPSDVKAILSVDISAWDQRGRRIQKEAFNCTDQEIAEEVFEQLREMLNKQNRPDVLRRDMLVGGKLERGLSYHLDESIVDLRDRKKQASYERARGVKFNTLDLVAAGEGEPREGTPGGEPNDTLDDGYMWGPKQRFNAEPLLVNRAGSRELRPEARTSIPNLFLAGDFIRTETDLACMEGANEAARLATNAVLDAAGSREPRCQIWPFSPSRDAVQAVMGLSGMAAGIGTATAAISRIQDRVWKTLALGMLRVQAGSTNTDDRWSQELPNRR